MSDRLQKLISAAGLMSRRAAEEAIKAGRVSVNGRTAALGDRAEPTADEILVDGRVLPSTEVKRYIMLNKPKGYVCSLSDEKGRRNVTELVDIPGVRLYPVGRLDMNSEGLLVLTNDGDFANILMHPSHNFVKTYRTWVRGDNIAAAIEKLREPMDIDGCMVHAKRAEAEKLYSDGALLSVSISEGRNRQVRKMCAQVGLKVTRLQRVSEGPLSLGSLPSGKWRELSGEEISQIMENYLP